MVVEIITDVYIPIKWSERRDDRKHPMCRSIGNGWREVTYVVSRYQMIRFMFRETGFLVTTSSHNITTTWVVRKQRIAAKVSD